MSCTRRKRRLLGNSCDNLRYSNSRTHKNGYATQGQNSPVPPVARWAQGLAWETYFLVCFRRKQARSYPLPPREMVLSELPSLPSSTMRRQQPLKKVISQSGSINIKRCLFATHHEIYREGLITTPWTTCDNSKATTFVKPVEAAPAANWATMPVATAV